jgi:surfactin family lipopeptide synthetase A
MNDLAQRLTGLSAKKQALLRLRLKQRQEDYRHFRTIPPRMNGGAPPLSFSQERIWLHEQFEPGSVAYHRPANFRLRGPLQIEPLRQALETVAARHESLRTTLANSNESPRLVVQPAFSLELPLTDLSGEADPELSAGQLAREEAARPFDLQQGPLFRCRLLRIACQDHLLLLTFHHFTFDAWSQSVLLEELIRGYAAYVEGAEPRFAPLAIQYADFAEWDRSPQRVTAIEEDRAYWRRELSAPPVLQLPTDFPAGAASEEAGSVEIALPAELVAGLRQIARCEQATFFSVLLAAFTALLHRYSGERDIVVGCPVAGRNCLETEGLIGLFINTLPIRVRLETDGTFRQLLSSVRENVLLGLQHQDVPLQLVVQDVLKDRRSGRSPLFQAMFIHEHLPQPTGQEGPVLFQPEDSGPLATTVDLTLELTESAAGVRGRFVYRRDLWQHATIERIAGHFLTMLNGIAADAAQTISRLPLLTHQERHQLLVEWNDTALEYPREKCLHELFEAQVDCTPDAIALVFQDRHLTYRELNSHAERLADHLRAMSVGPGKRVGLCLDRSMEMAIGSLGILKTGGAYVPLDPDYPLDRLDYMVRDSHPAALVTTRALAERLPHRDIPMLLAGKEPGAFERSGSASYAGINDSQNSSQDKIAYVIYTSGSTGRPKGVMISQEAIVNFLFGMQRLLEVQPTDVLLAVTTLSFDIAGLELYLPLLAGARVVIAPQAAIRDGRELAALLDRSQATIMQATPATWRILLASGWAGKADLRILCGGEALPADLARLLLQRCTALWNLYGPTETTVYSTACPIGDADSVTLGRPIANTQVYVLNTLLEPVPVGVPGELHIGGSGLARGYLHQPELTAEKFIRNPFSNEPGSRLYKTGDVVEWATNGELLYLGRADNQVKLRGARIELGEIESALRQHPQIVEAAAALCDVRGDNHIVAYPVFRDGSAVPSSELRTCLRGTLPEYMVPSFFVPLDRLPLTPNGKIDRRSLPPVDRGCMSCDSAYVAPRTAIEEALAGIWMKMFGIERVGVRDNFFDLGGHSLLVVRMLARVSEVTGCVVPLPSFFRSATIEELALLISANRTAVDLVWPLAKGEKTPVVAVGDGKVAGILQKHLPSNHPLHWCSLPSEDGSRFQHGSVRELATDYCQRLSASGLNDYALVGFCLGGVLAYEMACQLQPMGRKSPLLFLIEPSAIIEQRRATDRKVPTSWTRKIVRRLRLLWLNTRARMGIQVPAYWRWFYMWEHLRRLIVDYEPKQFPGRMVVVYGTEYPPEVLAAWRALCSGTFSAYPLNCPGHLTFREDPLVWEEWNCLLTRELNQISASVPAG